jgi:hypothetical protein
MMSRFTTLCLCGFIVMAFSGASVGDDEENIYDLISFGKTEALRTLLSKKPSLATSRHGRYGETPDRPTLL